MRFYRGNLIEGAFTMDTKAVIGDFLDALRGKDRNRYVGFGWEQSLRVYLTDPDGFNASWDEANFDVLRVELGEQVGRLPTPAREQLQAVIFGDELEAVPDAAH